MTRTQPKALKPAGFLIRVRDDSRFLKQRPVFGRFLSWTSNPAEAHVYRSLDDAAVDAEFTWRGEWADLVEIVNHVPAAETESK